MTFTDVARIKKAEQGLGGQIWAESAYGQGSTFHFTIPVDDES